MYNLFSIILLIISCSFLLRLFHSADIAESILVFFCLFTAHVVTLGYILSSMNHLSYLNDWFMLSFATAVISICSSLYLNRNKATGQFVSTLQEKVLSITPVFSSIKNGYMNKCTRFEKWLLTPLIITALVLGTLNILVIVFTAPQNPDSMAYHLARVAYYFQHNNLNSFVANYWAQVIHPKNSTLLFLYTYLISGLNENLTQLVQYISYWIAVVSVYAISRKTGSNKRQSIFAAMISALLIEWLMEATTTQNDLILTAYIGTIVYFFFAFRETHKWKYFVLAAMGIGLSLGTKASSFLAWPSIGLIALYVIFHTCNQIKQQHRFHAFALLKGCTHVSVCVFYLPAGYLENIRDYSHPIGPKNVRAEHSFEGKSIGSMIQNGTKNVIRFQLDFLSLDGMPNRLNIVRTIQNSIRYLPVHITRTLGVDLNTEKETRAPFDLYKQPVAHEDGSYWGIFGFGLIWIMVFLSLLGVIKSTDIRVLSFAAVLFFLIQSYIGPYDPWRGRYFCVAAIFAVPSVGCCLHAKHKFIRGYLILLS